MKPLAAATRPTPIELECLPERVDDRAMVYWEALGIPVGRIEDARAHVERMRWAWLWCQHEKLLDFLKGRGLPETAKNLVFWAESWTGELTLHLTWTPMPVVIPDDGPLPLMRAWLPAEEAEATITYRTEWR